MTGPIDPETRLIQFLLGSLSEVEHEQVEERLFTDEHLQNDLEATRDDLIHAYLAGSLSVGDRRRFEAYFLASGNHRERVAFMKDLLAAVGRVGQREATSGRVPTLVGRGLPMKWAIAAGVVLAAAAAILGLFMRSTQRETAWAVASPGPSIERDTAAPQETLRPSPAPVPRVDEPPPPVPHSTGKGRVHFLRLPADQGTGPTEVRLAPATRVVRLEVHVEEGPPSYDAIIRETSGEEIWRAEGLAPTSPGGPLLVTVPAEILGSADYILAIEGEALRGTDRPEGPLFEHRLRVVRRR